MTATQILGFVGILFIIGFLADYLFKRTGFPDILILLALGYVAGHVAGIIDPASLVSAAPIIANLALIVILFNGGLELEFHQARDIVPRAVALAFIGTGVSMIAAASIVHYLLGWDQLSSLLLGAIVGGNSPSVVIPLMARSKVPAAVSSLLRIESAVNGTLVVVVAIIILELMRTGGEASLASAVARTTGITLLIGIGIGAATGFAWLWVLAFIEGELYDDILTLAVLFLLCLIVEHLKGSVAIFALTFGLVLGNGVDFARFLRTKRSAEIHNTMMKFHSQMSFAVRTFFFAYLGLTITIDEPGLILPSLALCLALLAVRSMVIPVISLRHKQLAANKGILVTMLPRGLSAAVVAGVVASSGVAYSHIYAKIVILVILITVLVAAASMPAFTKRLHKGESGQK